MSSNNSKTKETNSAKQDPIKTIRRGAVAASIWKRQTPTGFAYLDFSLSRSWKLKSGEREGYSQNFFETNQEALFYVVEEACEFIRENEPAASPMESDSGLETAATPTS